MVTLAHQDASQHDPRRWWALGALFASMLVLGRGAALLPGTPQVEPASKEDTAMAPAPVNAGQ